MNHQVRVIFMGTPQFAVPSLDALVRDGYDVVGVFTQPDRPVGRKRVLEPSPVKVLAETLGLPVFQPERVRSPESLDEIRRLAPDICITAAYGQILPQKLLDIPKYGCLNVHASLLPRWRGAAPIHRAIIAGDSETGVTLMRMVLALDAGPSLAMETVVIEKDDTYGTLHDKLAEMGARMVSEFIPPYIRGQIEPTEQPETGVTYADKIVRSDEFIDWSGASMDVYNHIRGLTPWPGATSYVDGHPVKVWSAKHIRSTEYGETNKSPALECKHGVAELHPNEGVLVSCIGGFVRLLEVQPAGKKRMSAEDWFRGLKQKTVQFTNGEQAR